MTIPDVAWRERKNTKTLKQNSLQATTKLAAPKRYDLCRETRGIFSFKSFPTSPERKVPYSHYLLSRTNKSEDESRASTTADTSDEFRGRNFTFRRSSSWQVMPYFPPEISRDYKACENYTE